MTVVTGLLALAVGLLIGSVGVGGVLLAPGLLGLTDLTVHEATATSTWAFLLAGAVGTWVYARRGVVPWPMLLRLGVGVVPAAFGGAVVAARLPAGAVLLALAVLTLAVGVHQLWARPARASDRDLGTTTLVALGAVVGVGSAVTGTSGPVILVPVLLLLGVQPIRAIAVSQAVQLPVVVAGSIGYLRSGLVDLGLGTVLAIVVAVGAAGGAMIATRVPAEGLRRVVAGACLVAGALIVWRLVD